MKWQASIAVGGGSSSGDGGAGEWRHETVSKMKTDWRVHHSLADARPLHVPTGLVADPMEGGAMGMVIAGMPHHRSTPLQAPGI